MKIKTNSKNNISISSGNAIIEKQEVIYTRVEITKNVWYNFLGNNNRRYFVFSYNDNGTWINTQCNGFCLNTDNELIYIDWSTYEVKRIYNVTYPIYLYETINLGTEYITRVVFS